MEHLSSAFYFPTRALTRVAHRTSGFRTRRPIIDAISNFTPHSAPICCSHRIELHRIDRSRNSLIDRALFQPFAIGFLFEIRVSVPRTQSAIMSEFLSFSGSSKIESIVLVLCTCFNLKKPNICTKMNLNLLRKVYCLSNYSIASHSKD